MENMMPDLFLGLDSSTQSLSACVIDSSAKRVIYESKISYDKDLPEYGTTNGVLNGDNPEVVHSPPLMWAEDGSGGSNANRHRSVVNISFDTQSQAPSTFDVEIKGADRFIRTIGPGSKQVVITGNVATALSIRFKSHSLGQNIVVFI